MDYKVTSTDGGLKFELNGDLTFETHRDFKKIIGLINDDQKNIEISLAGLTHIDSAGAGMLMLAKDKAKQSGGLVNLTDIPENLQSFVSLLQDQKLQPVH